MAESRAKRRAHAAMLSTDPLCKVFAAKFGFALHYKEHGEPIPSTGGVRPRWFSNVQAAEGKIPMQVVKLLPPRQTLRQGKNDVSDQFEYSWRATESGRHGVAYAVFRSSFAILALTSFDRSEFLENESGKLPLF